MTHSLRVSFFAFPIPAKNVRNFANGRKAQIVRLLQTASNPSLLSLPSEEFKLPPLEAKGLPITQLIDRYPDYETPAKFEAVESLVRQATSQDEKVIVWTWFVHNIKMLSRRLEDLGPLQIYGDIPKDYEEDASLNREKILDAFKTDKDSRILIANPSATAESISLHKVCRKAIYMDRTFNCGQYLQSLDRIHRVGLAPDDVVRYQIIVADGTIDEVVNQRLNEKAQRMGTLLEDDLPILDLEQASDEVTGSEGEVDEDFDAVVRYLQEHKTDST